MDEYDEKTREGLMEKVSALSRRVSELEGREAERAAAMAASQKREEAFRLLFEKSRDPAMLVEGGKFIECNEAALALTRATGRDRLIGLGPTHISPQWQPDGTLSALKIQEMNRIALKQGTNRFLWRCRALDGEEFGVEISETAVPIPGREVTCTVWRSIEARSAEDETFRESERKFRSLVERSVAGVYLIQDGVFRYCNAGFAGMLGYTVDEMTDRIRPQDIVFPDDYRDFSAENIRKRLDGEIDSLSYEVRLVTKTGEIRYAEAYGSRTMYRGRPAVIGTIVDVTNRKLAERALKESEERYRAVFEITGAGTLIIEHDMTVSFCNTEFERLSGYRRDEIEGKKKWTEFVAAEDLERMTAQHELRRKERDKAVQRYEFRLVTRSGEMRTIYIVVDMIPGTLKSVASLIDITDRKLMEEELARARNLESIGTLAGGIAHDFNNLLMAVTGYISLASLYLSPGDETYTLLEEAQRISLAGKDLTDKLLTFSKGGAPVRKIINPARIVEQTASAGLSGSAITWEWSCADGLFGVEADEAQITQVMANLVQNAREAMPSGGLLRIIATNRTYPEGDPGPLLPGDYVELSLEDQGVGIPPEDLPKIFDPYFTTKGLGAEKGMGLGLAVAYSIMKRHNGYIDVRSEQGKGTTVRLTLPAHPGAKGEDEAHEKADKAPAGSILFMDDDEFVRNIGVKLVAHLGYEVTPAKDGQEVVDFYEEALKKGKPFDAVILDLTVKGGMGGREAFDSLRVMDPHVKGIICSGYTDDPVISQCEAYGFLGAITKPYKMDELRQMLDRAMGT